MTATLKIKNDRYYAVINYKDGSEYRACIRSEDT